jgi:predicted DNA-binding mobile mystery protein A
MPGKGWIKEVRTSLGMSMQDLAKRLGVIPSRINRIEKDEIAGKVTLETMSKAAAAMNCEFIYFIVPKEGTLQSTIEIQAKKSASEILNSVNVSMSLEDQDTTKEAKEKMHNKIVHELLTNERKLWK